MTRILIVRMSALGDIVHALPVLAAIRDHFPGCEVDWLADRKYAGILDFVDGLSRCIIGRPGLSRAVAEMRRREYDVALDLQGLLKSAAMARLSGASRVVGFDASGLREPAAQWFYGETAAPTGETHVIAKNLALLSRLDITPPPIPRFPIAVPRSAVADEVFGVARAGGAAGVALINAGAAWPNKRWPPGRFGQIARYLRTQHQLAPVVLWGAQEQALADAVVAASDGAALRAPETTLGDLLALSARSSLIVSGDTGPLHVAAAVGTPIVGLYGPTWPERNGPFRKADMVISRAEHCDCHHKRRCRRDARSDADSRMCINDIAVGEVIEAIDCRLAAVAAGSR